MCWPNLRVSTSFLSVADMLCSRQATFLGFHGIARGVVLARLDDPFPSGLRFQYVVLIALRILVAVICPLTMPGQHWKSSSSPARKILLRDTLLDVLPSRIWSFVKASPRALDCAWSDYCLCYNQSVSYNLSFWHALP